MRQYGLFRYFDRVLPCGLGCGQVIEKSGERGRNRTSNLLIKSYVFRCGCRINNCSHDNNLMIKRPAWTAFKNVEKVGEIESRLTPKDTKKTQRTLADFPGSRLILSVCGIAVKGR
jgi:hypothetical protein